MYFNVRVYGLLINEHNQVLLADEEVKGYRFTKFPGGGLEFGEGLKDALEREFMEECYTEIEVLEHFYTTDFFVKSAFNDSQIISIYYKVATRTILNVAVRTATFDFSNTTDELLAFRWKDIKDLQPQDVTFPIDQHVIELLKKQA